jgi:hypothetical protein
VIGQIGGSYRASVLRFMAHSAESDQVRIVIIALLAAQLLVVDMQIFP